MRNKNKKGVSPLIAAVLLIAFTMAIAAILTAWVTSFTTEQKEQSEEFSEQISCSGQSFRTDSDFTVYYPADGVFQVRIKNTGNRGLYIDEYRVWVPSSSTPVVGSNFAYKHSNGTWVDSVNRTETISKNMLSGEINISVSEEPTKVQYSLTKCEGVYDSVTRPSGGWSAS